MDRARKLLRLAANSIEEELYAAGEDEVRQHPTLRAKRRLVTRIDKFLSTPEKKHVKSKRRA